MIAPLISKGRSLPSANSSVIRLCAASRAVKSVPLDQNTLSHPEFFDHIIGQRCRETSHLFHVRSSLTLKNRFPVTIAVALNVDRHRESGDVGGIGFDVDIQSRHCTPQSLRPDTQLIDLFQKLFFQLGNLGIGMPFPTGRRSAFLEIIAAFSNVPPIPTPTMTGGQGLAPDSSTRSTMYRFTPSIPTAGGNATTRLIISPPNPLVSTESLSLSPGTTST